MKKNKVILLSILAVGIWGFIAFKIVAGSDGDLTPSGRRIIPRKEAPADSAEVFKFDFSYGDPFLKKKSAATKTAAMTTKSSYKRATSKPSRIILNIKWERIKYKGSMRNTSKKTTVVSVSLDGNDYIVHPGESFGDFKVMDVWPDSIRVSCEDNVHFIKKEK